MPPTALNPLFPLVEDLMIGRLHPPCAAEALYRAVLNVSLSPVDAEECAQLRHVLRIFSEVPELTATIADLRRWLRLSLERAWRQDPSKLDLLLEIARIDLSCGETEYGRHILRRIARSGYRAADEARRLLADLPPAPERACRDAGL